MMSLNSQMLQSGKSRIIVGELHPLRMIIPVHSFVSGSSRVPQRPFSPCLPGPVSTGAQ